MKEWARLASHADPEHHFDDLRIEPVHRLPEILLQLADAFRRVHASEGAAGEGIVKLLQRHVSLLENWRTDILRQQVRLSGSVYDIY